MRIIQEEIINWRWQELNYSDDINSGKYSDLIWALLRGQHIDLEMKEYALLEDLEDEFTTIFRTLGFELVKDIQHFFYVQRPNVSSEERQTANKFCAVFFIFIQQMQDKSDSGREIDLQLLLDRKGYNLEKILSVATLPDHLSRILIDVGLHSDEEIERTLVSMSNLKLIEKIENSPKWRFRKGISRLERLAREFAIEGEEE